MQNKSDQKAEKDPENTKVPVKNSAYDSGSDSGVSVSLQSKQQMFLQL